MPAPVSVKNRKTKINCFNKGKGKRNSKKLVGCFKTTVVNRFENDQTVPRWRERDRLVFGGKLSDQVGLWGRGVLFLVGWTCSLMFIDSITTDSSRGMWTYRKTFFLNLRFTEMTPNLWSMKRKAWRWYHVSAEVYWVRVICWINKGLWSPWFTWCKHSLIKSVLVL